jgi:hypothetical protein
MYTKYSTKGAERFDELLYPGVTSEVSNLRLQLVGIESAQKAAIVISLLKDHSIRTEWLHLNRKLAKLILSGSLSTSHVESLFNACSDNPKFTKSFENFITAQLGQP